MKSIKEFVSLSKYAGERFDLIQAGGGNTSIKTNNSMIIKSSGYSLSEISETNGYTIINTSQVQQILENKHLGKIQDKKQKNQFASQLLQNTVITQNKKPSIETFFHVFLDTYVLHTHPIVVNAITCNPLWNNILQKLFPKSLCLKYYTPGIELALSIQKKLTQLSNPPQIIFLQNHGLIIHGPSKTDIINKTEKVLTTIEKEIKSSFSKFKLVTKISKLINSLNNNEYQISYLSQDKTIIKLIKKNKLIALNKPLSPDFIVYCGFHAIELSNINNPATLIFYKNKYHEIPKVVIYKEHIFFIAQNINKAKQIEDVVKSQLIITDLAKNKLHYLPLQEQKFLANCTDEKYRKNLGK